MESAGVVQGREWHTRNMSNSMRRLKNGTLNLESIPSYREREQEMKSILLCRSYQLDHTLHTCAHFISVNSGKINQIVLENVKHILLAEMEICVLLRQTGGKLSGSVIAVYKYISKAEKNKRDSDLFMLKSHFGIGMNESWIH